MSHALRMHAVRGILVLFCSLFVSGVYVYVHGTSWVVTVTLAWFYQLIMWIYSPDIHISGMTMTCMAVLPNLKP